MLTEQVNVDFLETVHTAELVEFVVDLVEYERFVVVSREVFHNFMNLTRFNMFNLFLSKWDDRRVKGTVVRRQKINHFDFVEINKNTTTLKFI
jgi:hypothetical protein